jgi:uncharacterized membrane protein
VTGAVTGLFGRLHPLLLHFPIAFVLGAAAAEIAAIVTKRDAWRALGVVIARAAAVTAVATGLAGWAFSRSSFVEPGPLLEWHRWLGVGAAGASVLAALASRSAVRWPHAYRSALFTAAALVTATAHLGGLLVWGPDFFRR